MSVEHNLRSRRRAVKARGWPSRGLRIGAAEATDGVNSRACPASERPPLDQLLRNRQYSLGNKLPDDGATSEMAWMDFYVRGKGMKFSWRDVLKTLEEESAARKGTD